MLAGRYRALIGSAFGCLAVIAGGSLVAQASKQAVIDKNVNLIVGMPPALRAMRLNIVDALADKR